MAVTSTHICNGTTAKRPAIVFVDRPVIEIEQSIGLGCLRIFLYLICGGYV